MNDETNSRNTTAGSAAAVEEKLSAAVDSAQQTIVESVRPASQSVQTFVQQQKALGAEQIRGVARAVRSAAREFETQLPGVARSAQDAAAKLDDASSSLRDQSPQEISASVGRFARQQPAVFFVGCVLAGFALSRFLKSSADRRSD